MEMLAVVNPGALAAQSSMLCFCGALPLRIQRAVQALALPLCTDGAKSCMRPLSKVLSQ